MELLVSDHTRIYVRIYEPEHEVIGRFHILHGMGEHGGRYDAFATMLCEQGYFVTMHDHRGHGKTAELNGKLGYFADENGFERVVEDVYDVIQNVRYDYKKVPIFIFGHSMGSFIARRFIQVYGEIVDGCILCGTGATTTMHKVGNMLAKTMAKTKGKDVRGDLLNELSLGSFNKQFKNTKTAFDWLTSDEEEVQKYIDDPYCGFIPTNQFFADLTDGLIMINRIEENARIPKNLLILLISGSSDPVGNNGKGVYKVANQLKNAGAQNVIVYLFEEMRHEILNERNKQQVFDVVSRWLKKYEK
ncbi:alpha/beta hydrolase [Ureibacillus massiliensis 4400831 = CIP 108448 = CCUG 49529]|uniref:Alpha/beta hydrolase n=2 Tax=Ureibacillus massiliensis TaxID=292806 RepID=A0A0A3J6A1_9BACL|nr:alpha/beta hydrolase [Ureibacillus massiliensis 4400831 = CIP 108448 = CCUG 49529]